jgi:hypothetical protein
VNRTQKNILYGGTAAAFLGLVTATFNLLAAWVVYARNHKPGMALSLILAVLLFVFPSLFIGAGSYVYAVKQRSWGLWLLGLGAIVSDLVIITAFVGIVWLNPTWIVLLFMLQFVLTTVVFCTAVFKNQGNTDRVTKAAK